MESSEVRVCSYSQSDVMPMAILLSVPEPTDVIQQNYLDTVLAENDPEHKHQFAPRDRDIVSLVTGLSVFRGITFVYRCLMISGKESPEIAMAYFVIEDECIKC